MQTDVLYMQDSVTQDMARRYLLADYCMLQSALVRPFEQIGIVDYCYLSIDCRTGSWMMSRAVRISSSWSCPHLAEAPVLLRYSNYRTKIRPQRLCYLRR